jgi:parafibromin
MCGCVINANIREKNKNQQDFSHVRKTAELFLGRNRSRTGQYPPGVKASSTTTNNKLHHPPGLPAPPAGLALPKKPGTATVPAVGAGVASGAPGTSSRRPDPIILLSPSASSLIRMSNIRSFLEDGVFIPPDHPSVATSTPSNILQIVRPLRLSGDVGGTSGPGAAGTAAAAAAAGKKPTRFILVDSTANFKPDYWSRLVAVFTTGQTWQFKSYKWTTGYELFKHATGIYVGWRGEDLPREVRGWGRGVKTFAVERWDEKGGGVHGAGRWRDREVVEGIWMAIEEGMRAGGWGSGK